MTAALKLREYQEEALAALTAGWNDRGLNRLAVVLPTGLGKTVIFAELAARYKRTGFGRVLILVHREELVSQAVQKLRRARLDGGRGQGSPQRAGRRRDRGQRADLGPAPPSGADSH
jgi:superfamily II DNA or RNA helicase